VIPFQGPAYQYTLHSLSRCRAVLANWGHQVPRARRRRHIPAAASFCFSLGGRGGDARLRRARRVGARRQPRRRDMAPVIGTAAEDGKRRPPLRYLALSGIARRFIACTVKPAKRATDRSPRRKPWGASGAHHPAQAPLGAKEITSKCNVHRKGCRSFLERRSIPLGRSCGGDASLGHLYIASPMAPANG
jgi:hypothetical protein